MTTGSKIAIILMILALLAAIGGVVTLIADSASADGAERADIDMEAVGALIVKDVKAEADLPKLAELINKDELYEGEEKIQVDMLNDGSVLGWVDKNGDGQAEVRYTPEESAQIDQGDSPDSTEVVFRARASKEKGELVIADRYHHVYSTEVSEEFKKTEIWNSMLGRQYDYYGQTYWRTPRMWVFVYPGYYGGWSNSRASSIGGRFGSGGIGGGK